MSDLPAPLKITIYGVDNEIKREVTRSIVPWGILERALDIQEAFEGVESGALKLDRGQIDLLTNFVVFVFDDAITPDELKRGASLTDMFGLYRQIFAMVKQNLPQNPTTALDPKAQLQKVRRGRK